MAASPGGRLPDLPPTARAEALAAERWEADVLALPQLYEGSDDQRPVMALVTAGSAILHLDLWDIRASEPSDLVQALEDALASGAALLGEWPAMVAIRSAEVADLLRPCLEARGCGVTVVSPLPGLDATARVFIGDLVDVDLWPPIAAPVKWAGWGLPDEQVSELFSACAAFHRAAPWRWMDDDPPVFVEWSDGSDPWLVAVLGAAGMSEGLAVYADPSDYYEGTLGLGEGERPFQAIRGWILNLSYDSRNELPRPMQREVARAGWKVAAADAYPVLMPLFTPGGGLSRELVRRLTAVLRALTSFADEHGSRLREGSLPFHWDCDELVLSYEGAVREGPPLQELPPYLEGLKEKLESGEPPTLEELRAWVGERTEGYNATPQDELSGLTPAQAHALLEGDWKGGGPLRLTEDLGLDQLVGAPMLTNARILLQAVIERDGLPTTQAGNLRRVFVTEMLERMTWPDGYAERVLNMNKVINEDDVWGLHVLRVVLEVAGLLRRRKGRFKVTRDGRRLAGEQKASALLAHLFRAHYRDFNLAYGDRDAAAPTLQAVVPLLLWRIGAEARKWVDPEALAEQVLPDSLWNDPEDSPMLSDWGVNRCRRRVIEPLVEFGLLEERVLSSGGETWWRREVEVRVTPLFDDLLRFRWD